MFCPKCGNQIEDYVVVCPKCGYTSNMAGANSNQQGQPNQPVYTNPVYSSPVYQGTGYPVPESPKKKTGIIITISILVALLVIALIVGAFIIVPTLKAESNTKVADVDDDDDDDDDEIDDDDDDFDEYDIDDDNSDTNNISDEFAKYEIVVPNGYKLSNSKNGYAEYRDKNGNTIIILLDENEHEISIENIIEDYDDMFNESFERIGRNPSRSGDIVGGSMVTSGDYSGLLRYYGNGDRDFRAAMILANSDDVCYVFMFGMQDVEDAVTGTDILRK